MTDPTTLARGLSEAQRRVLLHGLTGNDTIATLRALKARGLMRVRYADPNPETGGWQLTDLGRILRNHLQGLSE